MSVCIERQPLPIEEWKSGFERLKLWMIGGINGADIASCGKLRPAFGCYYSTRLALLSVNTAAFGALMAKYFAAIAFTFALFTVVAFGEDAKEAAKMLEAAPNGCGSSWNTYLVPDSIPLMKCTFKKACDDHDGCYGKCLGRVRDSQAPECEYLRCNKGGDLHGTLECKKSIKFAQLYKSAMDRRKKCDVNIGLAIRETNTGRSVCQAFAYVYERAVKDLGETYFAGLDPVAQAVGQPQDAYERAIREFFERGSDGEFDAFNKNPPSFGAPLKFVPGSGLVNVPKTK